VKYSNDVLYMHNYLAIFKHCITKVFAVFSSGAAFDVGGVA